MDGKAVGLSRVWGCAAAGRLVLFALCHSWVSTAWAQPQVKLVEESRAWGVVVADFNNDGHDDFFITGHDDDDRIWYWTPSGYRPSTQVFKAVDRHDCDAADVDGNGRLDLYCAEGARRGTGTGANQLWLQGGDGVFRKASQFGAEDKYGRSRIPVFLDFDHDGWPDIYITNEATLRTDGQFNHNHLFLNRREAGFVEHITTATGDKGFQCAARGDVNGDGWDDLVVCDGTRPGRIFVNNRAGDFEVWQTAANAVAWTDAHLVDMNGDGRQDLVVATRTNEVQIWLNSGQGQRFSTPALNTSMSVKVQSLAIGDYNRDGSPDVYAVLSQVTCPTDLVDTSPDVLFLAQAQGGWLGTALPQARLPGCGYLAATVGGREVLLMQGGVNYVGPSFLLSWGP